MADSNPKAAKKGGPGRPFQKGQSGNPGGRVGIAPDVLAALKADTMEHYAECKRLITAAEAVGDLKTALHGRLSLLKKTIPDATEITISMPDGLSVKSITVDPRKLSESTLAAVLGATVVPRGG